MLAVAEKEAVTWINSVFFSCPPELMSGWQEQWTASSFCLMSWWWRSVEVWLVVLRTWCSVRECCIRCWLSITDTHNSLLCSATTCLTYTQASQSYWVRRGTMRPQQMVSEALLWLWLCWLQANVFHLSICVVFFSEWQTRAGSGGSTAEPEAAGLSQQGGAA